jgi:hypothetical protein
MGARYRLSMRVLREELIAMKARIMSMREMQEARIATSMLE